MDFGPAQYADTIYALSSGQGVAGVAVVRVSGPAVRDAVGRIAGSLPEPRAAALRRLRNADGDVIDTGLVLFFPGPASFTGEDCAEFQVHGGRAVLSSLFGALSRIEGCRPAEAGEFTRRAFDSGRIDLTAAEGLADLISAETEMQRRAALSSADGELAALYEGWAERLTDCRATLEARIDFFDEEDVAASDDGTVDRALVSLCDTISGHLASAHRGEIVRGGFRVAIAGAPNTGKSSLMNALARRDVSIVSEEAGTTRDIVSVRLDVAGYAVEMSDTAGLREAEGIVEQEGIRRARDAAAKSDLVLQVADLSGPEEAEAETGRVPSARDSGSVLRVGTKCDLRCAETDLRNLDVITSARLGTGLDQLIQAIAGRVASVAPASGGPLFIGQRHRGHLEACVAHIRAATDESGLPEEFRAEELRLAGACIGRITGRIDVETVLGRIFSQFCIGK